MSDENPVPPPAAGIPPAFAAPTGYAPPVYAPRATKRRLWPFFVGGGVLLLLLMIGAGSVIATVLVAAAHERDRENVEQVIRDFDSSYENADCGDFEDITTEDFRDDYAATYYEADSFDCDDWDADAEALSEDGDYLYSVEVNKVVVYTDEATVRTTEQVEGGDKVDFVYELERLGGRWLITSYEED